ncbi:MAG: tetratricopeptide repeat protein [Pseudomonadota bacterium]
MSRVGLEESSQGARLRGRSCGWGGIALLMLAVCAPPERAAADVLSDLVSRCAAPETPVAEVLTACERALAQSGDRLDHANRAAVHYNAGVAALDLGRAVQAEGHFAEAVVLQPRMAEAHVSLGLALEAQAKHEAAIESYGRAISADAASPGAWLARGRLLLRTGRPAEAVADFTDAISREPEWEASFLERGRAHFALADYRRAEADFSAVIARAPRDPAAWLYRAEARSALGIAAARNDFDRAVMLAPEWGAARYARGLWFEAAGEAEAAATDFLRAYELGHSAPGLTERVRALSAG